MPASQRRERTGERDGLHAVPQAKVLLPSVNHHSSRGLEIAAAEVKSLRRTGAVANGWAWAYDATSLTDSYQMYAMSELITVRAAATVPESGPWSISALLAGSIGFSAWRRRRPNTVAEVPAEPQAA